jgi:hypothetical protein
MTARRYIAMSTGICRKLIARFMCSSNRSTMNGGYTPLSGICAGGVRAETCGSKHRGGRYAAAFFVSFLRHQEIYPSDEGASIQASAPARRLDEFPTGYSSAGWSQPLLASASPAAFEYGVNSLCRSITFQRTARCVLTICLSRGGKRTMASCMLRDKTAGCCGPMG